MSLPLVCVAHHPHFPSLVPGNTLLLAADGRTITLSIPATPTILQRIAQAIADGALVPHLGGGQPFEAIEAHVQSEWELLTARIDAALVAVERDRLDPPAVLLAG